MTFLFKATLTSSNIVLIDSDSILHDKSNIMLRDGYHVNKKGFGLLLDHWKTVMKNHVKSSEYTLFVHIFE